MKTSLKITLAAAVVALTIASCWRKAPEANTSELVDPTQIQIDTTKTGSDTIVP